MLDHTFEDGEIKSDKKKKIKYKGAKVEDKKVKRKREREFVVDKWGNGWEEEEGEESWLRVWQIRRKVMQTNWTDQTKEKKRVEERD